MTAAEIQKNLRTLADPAVAASSLRFFKKTHVEHDVFLGLRAATLRQLANQPNFGDHVLQFNLLVFSSQPTFQQLLKEFLGVLVSAL